MLAVVGLTLTVTPAAGGGGVCFATPAPHPATKNATRSRLQANHILLIRSNLGGILFARSIPVQIKYESPSYAPPTGRTSSSRTGLLEWSYFNTGSTRFE